MLKYTDSKQHTAIYKEVNRKCIYVLNKPVILQYYELKLKNESLHSLQIIRPSRIQSFAVCIGIHQNVDSLYLRWPKVEVIDVP